MLPAGADRGQGTNSADGQPFEVKTAPQLAACKIAPKNDPLGERDNRLFLVDYCTVEGVIIGREAWPHPKHLLPNSNNPLPNM